MRVMCLSIAASGDSPHTAEVCTRVQGTYKYIYYRWPLRARIYAHNTRIINKHPDGIQMSDIEPKSEWLERIADNVHFDGYNDVVSANSRPPPPRSVLGADKNNSAESEEK